MNLSHVLSSVSPLPFVLSARLKTASNFTIVLPGLDPVIDVKFLFDLTPEMCSFQHLAEKLDRVKLYYKGEFSSKDTFLFKNELRELTNTPVETNKYESKVCGAVELDVVYELNNVKMEQHPDYFRVEPILEELATGADFKIPVYLTHQLISPSAEQVELLRPNSLYDLKFNQGRTYLDLKATPEAAVVEMLLNVTTFLHGQLNYALDHSSNEMTDTVEVISNYYKFMEITARELAAKLKDGESDEIIIETPAFTLVTKKVFK